MSQPEDAPWRYVFKIVNIDGKEYTVYYLGKHGKELLENAQCKQQCHDARWGFEQEIKQLRSMLKVLTDIIGGPSYMVEYFKGQMLIQLNKKACRPSELIDKPYVFFKITAFNELVKEGKVHKNKGWVKL